MLFYEDTAGNEIMFAEEFVTPDVEAMILMTAAPSAHEKLRETFRLLHDQEDLLLAAATPGQLAIAGGDYCLRVVEQPDAEPLRIYGQIMTAAEIQEKERLAGADQWKIDKVRKIFSDGRQKGWVYGIWFSAVELDGDLGCQHVGTLEVITREEFERARAATWEPA